MPLATGVRKPPPLAIGTREREPPPATGTRFIGDGLFFAAKLLLYAASPETRFLISGTDSKGRNFLSLACPRLPRPLLFGFWTTGSVDGFGVKPADGLNLVGFGAAAGDSMRCTPMARVAPPAGKRLRGIMGPDACIDLPTKAETFTSSSVKPCRKGVTVTGSAEQLVLEA